MLFDEAKVASHGSRRWLVFLLAPSLVLTLLASMALVQDRRAALGEATERARDVADAASREAARILTEALTVIEPPSSLEHFESRAPRWVIGRMQIDAPGHLTVPSPRVWPPTPAPLPTLPNPDLQKTWDLAVRALASSRWDEAREAFDSFLRKSPPVDTAIARRYRLNALWLRALAESQSNPEAPPSIWNTLWTEASMAPEYATTEAGVTVLQLAVWRGLEMATRQHSKPPDAWLKKPFAWIDRLANSPGSPLLEEIRSHAGVLAAQWAAVQPEGHRQPGAESWTNRIHAVFDQADRRRALGAKLVELGAGSNTLPNILQFHADTGGEENWVVRETATAKGDAGFQVIDAIELRRAVADAWARLPGRASFWVEWELKGAGTNLASGVHPTTMPPLAISTVGNLPMGLELQVRVGLQDPVAHYAASRRRQWLFGGAGLFALATSLAGAVATQRAMARNRALAVRQANFISSVSHELRAPIAGVQLLAEGLESGRESTPEQRREFAQLIGRECRRLAALVENVLDLGRIERGQKRYDFEPLDLRALVVETGALMQSLARQGGVRLAIHTPESGEGCEILGDGGALQQALTNLIDNALKHAPAGSVVDVVLKANPPGRFRIEVSDTGPGVPEESRQRIFEPFQRLETELRRSTTGIGIGLTLARHSVHAHGGTIGVETSPSGGARFVIELPSEAQSMEAL